jgi:D-hydroxyproline dehydrogenase subunit beta
MPIRYLDDPPPTAEVVVVGGGVIGAATAFHLARAGVRPLIVEARPRLCTLTTPVAAGAFRLQFDNREELDLVRESAETFLQFEDVTGQDDYRLDVRLRGYLWLTTDEERAARQKELVDRLHGWGQTDVELMEGDHVRARWPWVSPDVIHARWRAGDGFLDTKRLTFGLVAGSGADVLVGTAVTGFGVEGGRLVSVETPRGPIACGAAVISAGPLSGNVSGLAGLELPVVTVRRQKLILPTVPEIDPEGPMVIDEDTGAHWRPAHEHGAWLLHTDPATPPSEPTMNVPVDHRFAFGLLDPSSPTAVARVVPFWRDVWERGSDHWLLQAGQYTVTPDHRPLIGPTRIEGLFVNTGYSGHGIMLGPAGGRICASAIVDGSTPNPFDPRVVRSAAPPPTL